MTKCSLCEGSGARRVATVELGLDVTDEVRTIHDVARTLLTCTDNDLTPSHFHTVPCPECDGTGSRVVELKREIEDARRHGRDPQRQLCELEYLEED